MKKLFTFALLALSLSLLTFPPTAAASPDSERYAAVAVDVRPGVTSGLTMREAAAVGDVLADMLAAAPHVRLVAPDVADYTVVVRLRRRRGQADYFAVGVIAADALVFSVRAPAPDIDPDKMAKARSSDEVDAMMAESAARTTRELAREVRRWFVESFSAPPEEGTQYEQWVEQL
ncbi:MAG: hypothetical protein LBR38_07290 [Synergistaceae bacterium]|jgi:hypothetical protein|nr:hypothetical protein [Synergistaceae bacterium]